MRNTLTISLARLIPSPNVKYEKKFIFDSNFVSIKYALGKKSNFVMQSLFECSINIEYMELKQKKKYMINSVTFHSTFKNKFFRWIAKE